MPVNATVLRGPFSSPAISSHPVLSWYAKYTTDFRIGKTTTPPTKYYASTATIVHPDNSSISGAQQIGDYYISLYGQFERCSYDLISVTVLSNNQTEEHTLIVEAFVYEIAKAEDGYGTDGLQIWNLRCYFDKGLLQKAACI